MRILITGGTGLIGKALGKRLVGEKHEVVMLSRDSARAKEKINFPAEIFEWDSEHGYIPKDALKDLDGIVHLLGENIADGRWTKSKKEKIYNSRVVSTKNLIQSFSHHNINPPRVIISGSAVGYYGNKGSRIVTENSSAGTDFLAEVCQDWEKALFESASSWVHVRRIATRTGLVLARDEGLLKKILPIFRRGLGGQLGSGDQWMSWIHIDDLTRLLIFALQDPRVSGPINSVAPYPLINRDFSKILGRILNKPTILPVPSLALKLALGELGDNILSSQRASAEKIESLGFKFVFPSVDLALRNLLQ